MDHDIVISQQFGWQRIRSWLTLMVVMGLALVISLPQLASANGLRENNAWQFETKSERTQKAAVLDLILKKQGGYYRPAKNITTNNITNYTTYDIAGPYIDCNMTSQALGNQGSIAQDAPVGSPSVDVGSTTSSSALGNSDTSTINSDGGSSGTGLIYLDDAEGDVSSDSAAGGTNTVNNSQSNDGSSQTSTTTGNSFDSDISRVSGSGGDGRVSLNSDQSLDDSSVTSKISDSSVCDFNVVSGSVDSPINSEGGD